MRIAISPFRAIGVALLCFLTVPSTSLARTACADYDGSLQHLGQIPLPGQAWGHGYDVGDLLALTRGSNLVIVDVSDPRQPSVLQTLPLPHAVFRVAGDGPLFHISSIGDGLWTYDVGTPGAAALRSQSLTVALDVSAQGDLVLVGRGRDGFSLLDFSDPDDPQLLSTTTIPDGQGGNLSTPWVHLHGSIAYVTATENREDVLYVFDITDPTAPALVRRHGYVGDESWFYQVGDRVAVADLNYTSFYDVTDPIHPAFLYASPPSRQYQLAEGPGGLVSGRTDNGFFVQDHFNPGSIETVASWSASTGMGAYSWRGNTVLLAANELLILDATSLQSVPSLEMRPGNSTALALGESHLYAVIQTPQSGLAVMDPVDLTVTGFVTTPWPFVRIAYGNGVVYLRSRQGGGNPDPISVIDVGDPTSPQVVTEVMAPAAGALTLEVDGDLLYAGGEDGRIWIYDISQASQPTLLGEWSHSNPIQALEPAGAHLYVADSAGGLVVDVGDPEAPATVGTFAIPHAAAQIHRVGSQLGVADEGGVRLYHLQDPTNPVIVGEWDGGQTDDVRIVGSTVFAHRVAGSVVALDIGNPAAPRLARMLLASRDNDMHTSLVDGFNRIFAATNEGVKAFPLPCGTPVPLLVQEFDAIADGPDVVVRGRLSEVAAVDLLAEAGGVVREVPLRIDPEGQFVGRDRNAAMGGPVRYRLHREDVSGEPTVLAERTFTPDLAYPLRILAVSPNPFNPRTTIQFVAPAGERAVVTVLDVRGREVATLFEGSATGIAQDLSWEPEGLGSGVYFVRVESGGKRDTTKTVLLK